ncbi:MAG: hypothetical protein JJE49_07475 [Peptostreptococcaceae bacterium]|nr:hypothetical protein [Peptostreptococcaceae bacterium]
MFLLKSSLLKKFAFFSMIAFAATGIMLGVIISNHVKGSFEVLQHTYKDTVIALSKAVGVPDGISGTDIPIGSRIISIADAYDAMTSDRPYRNGLSHEAAIAEIIKYKGVQFDSDIVEAFLTLEFNDEGK